MLLAETAITEGQLATGTVKCSKRGKNHWRLCGCRRTRKSLSMMSFTMGRGAGGANKKSRIPVWHTGMRQGKTGQSPITARRE